MYNEITKNKINKGGGMFENRLERSSELSKKLTEIFRKISNM